MLYSINKCFFHIVMHLHHHDVNCRFHHTKSRNQLYQILEPAVTMPTLLCNDAFIWRHQGNLNKYLVLFVNRHRYVHIFQLAFLNFPFQVIYILSMLVVVVLSIQKRETITII
jgi:hypothetical protein